ncbi:MAG: NAD(+) synthase [Candidatus Gastranaerophilaceae bacterium]
MEYNFDVKKAHDQCVKWIRDWFNQNGPDCNAIIGISGGKDSTIVAALCVEALGKQRVIGVLMPNRHQKDEGDAVEVCERLGIRYTEINICDAVEDILDEFSYADMYVPELDGYIENEISEQTKINLPARIRMATLYAVSQSYNGRVANTCNLSEDWVGYSTRYGDSVGDFSPCSNFTVTEMRQLGDYMGLPYTLVHKAPADGLCGKTDEENLGFTYEELDRYIRTGEIEDLKKKEKIDKLHKQNLFKLQLMPSFNFKPFKLNKSKIQKL